MAASQQLRPLIYLLLFPLTWKWRQVISSNKKIQHLSSPRLTASPDSLQDSIHIVQHFWWNAEWLRYHIYYRNARPGVHADSGMFLMLCHIHYRWKDKGPWSHIILIVPRWGLNETFFVIFVRGGTESYPFWESIAARCGSLNPCP